MSKAKNPYAALDDVDAAPTNPYAALDDVEDSPHVGGLKIHTPKWAQQQAEAAPEAPAAPSAGEAALRGTMQGASMGFADELGGAIRGLANAHDIRDLGTTYRASRDEMRGQDKAAQDAHPYAYGAGQVAGGIASTFAPGLGAVANAGKALGGFKAAMAGGAAIGAASGLGSSEADLTKGDVIGAVRDTAIGGAVGGAAGVIGHGLGSFVKNAPKRLDERVVKDLAGAQTKALATPTLQRALSENGANVREAVKEAGLKVTAAPSKLAPEVERATGRVGSEIGEVYQEAAKAHPGITMRSIVKPMEESAERYLQNPNTEALGQAMQQRIASVERTWGDRVVPKQEISEAIAKAMNGQLDDVTVKSLESKGLHGIGDRLRSFAERFKGAGQEVEETGAISAQPKATMTTGRNGDPMALYDLPSGGPSFSSANAPSSFTPKTAPLAHGGPDVEQAVKDLMYDSIHVSPVEVHKFVSSLGTAFEGSGLSGGVAKQLQRETWQAVKPVLTKHVEAVAPEAGKRLAGLNRVYSGLMDIGAAVEDRVAKEETRRMFSGVDATLFGAGLMTGHPGAAAAAVAGKWAMQRGLPMAGRAFDSALSTLVQSVRAGAPVAQAAARAAEDGLPQPVISRIVQAFGGAAQQTAEAQ